MEMERGSRQTVTVSPTARVAGLADSGVFQDDEKFGSTDAPYTDQMREIWTLAAIAGENLIKKTENPEKFLTFTEVEF